MSERGPIVCATDLGRTGARAVELAARLAAATDRPLRIVHVTGAGPDLVDEHTVGEAERVLRERLRTRIEASAAALEKERVRAEGFGPHAEAELLEGRPWEQLVEYATRWEASVVVVGPHGESGPVGARRSASLTEWVLGSTADRVVRHAPCPVLVGARDSDDAEGPGPIGRSTWLVAIDFSDASRAALKVAHELAGACGATLSLLHVEPGLQHRREGEPMRLADEAHAHKDQLEALCEETLGVRLEVHLAFGAPADSVSLVAEELGVHLIVMGTRGRTGLAHLLLGSVAEKTLRRSPVPVLVVRET